MMLKRTNRQPPHESLSDKIHRFRGVILVISLPLLLICFVLFLMPTRSPSDAISVNSFSNRKVSPDHIKAHANSSPRRYAVIFDAGSSGSRVHVFCFDQHLDLIPIGKDLELFVQKKPGLSAYAKDPKAAAESLLSLLEKAQSVIPEELQQKTPVRVGATAGLRQLQGDASDRILQAVTDFLKDKSTFKSNADSVTVLDGTQEGAYQWELPKEMKIRMLEFLQENHKAMEASDEEITPEEFYNEVTINYLLGNLGKRYSNTVGVVDLGGGSVQMAYAISEIDAAKAPRISDGEDTYVKEMYLKGTKYYLYVHSYLHYGLLAARAEILKVEDSGSPCILVGHNESYKYGGTSYPASASSSGSSMNECRRVATEALKVNESTCAHMKCTFGGVWNGGGGDGQNNLFVASFFFDRAAEAGFVNPHVPVAKVRPVDFETEAKRACHTKLEDAKSIYPHVEEDNLPYLCMDLVYQYTLLVDGFVKLGYLMKNGLKNKQVQMGANGLDPWKKITLVKKVEYQNFLVEAAWPLGSAIEVVSSLK